MDVDKIKRALALFDGPAPDFMLDSQPLDTDTVQSAHREKCECFQCWCFHIGSILYSSPSAQASTLHNIMTTLIAPQHIDHHKPHCIVLESLI